mgnify:CR=1 FL=1
MAHKPSLAETHPEVAKQWHPKLNGDLTPYDVTKGMNKKFGGNALKESTTNGKRRLTREH